MLHLPQFGQAFGCRSSSLATMLTIATITVLSVDVVVVVGHGNYFQKLGSLPTALLVVVFFKGKRTVSLENVVAKMSSFTLATSFGCK